MQLRVSHQGQRHHQRNDLKCEKESIIIVQIEGFSNMANVTGSWQHYLGLFSLKGHHHRASIKSSVCYSLKWQNDRKAGMGIQTEM